MWQLQGFDSENFIRLYWQKLPCVIREAFPDFTSPVSPEELAGLACEEDVHARLVIEQDGETPWQVRYGPFEEADFTGLPLTHYSLLVSECEKWIPELTALLDQFRFIPDWRIDDLMISYAPEHGSVGPHVDQYDVFLLQAQGQRRWQYAETQLENPEFIPGLELGVLQTFVPDQDIVLNPGDMLYLPPGFAHHGIALDACLTYSIGFRAPTASTTLESFALESQRTSSTDRRYRDPDLELDRHHAEITDVEIERFRNMATDLLAQPSGLWQDAVGKMLTDSAVTTENDDGQPVYVSDLLAGNWIRHPETRLLYHQSELDIQFYYNGRMHLLPQGRKILANLQEMCEQREWSTELIKRCLDIEPLEALLVELATNGAILSVDED